MLLVHTKAMAGGIGLVLIAALMLLLVSAGVQDARTRQIANWKNAAIALLAIPWWCANALTLWPDIIVQLAVAALVFALFFALFLLGQMGGGDVKMIGAIALWLPPQQLVAMLMMMTLIGGALAIIMLVAGALAQDKEKYKEIPYGIAISIASLIITSTYNINLL